MSIKLTDTQLVMLSAAAQREDRCIVPPPSLKGAAAQKIATKLVAAGLAKETKAKPGAHVWRRDDATRLAYGLKVTPAGLMAIAIEDAEAAEPAVQISPPATGEVPTTSWIMKRRRRTLRGQQRLPCRAKARNSPQSWTCSDTRTELRSISWPILHPPERSKAHPRADLPRGAAQSWRRSPNCFSGTMARQ